MRGIGGSGLLTSCDNVRLRQLALHSTISLIYEAFLHQLLTTPQLLHTANSPSLRCTADGCNAGVRSTCEINSRPAVFLYSLRCCKYRVYLKSSESIARAKMIRIPPWVCHGLKDAAMLGSAQKLFAPPNHHHLFVPCLALRTTLDASILSSSSTQCPVAVEARECIRCHGFQNPSRNPTRHHGHHYAADWEHATRAAEQDPAELGHRSDGVCQAGDVQCGRQREGPHCAEDD